MQRHNEDGFKKRVGGSRPSTAGMSRPPSGALVPMTNINRPGTAGQRRPSTAGGAIEYDQLQMETKNFTGFRDGNNNNNNEEEEDPLYSYDPGKGMNQSRPMSAGPLGRQTASPGEVGYFNGQWTDYGGGGSRPGTGGAYGAPGGSGYGSRPVTGGSSRPTTGDPKFVTMDKKVARFYGHFYQRRPWEDDSPLGDPIIEVMLPRRVTFYFYLVDDTVEITEPKLANTGMNAGRFFKRGKVEKANGEPLLITDMVLGSSVYMLGQQFFITDADVFTRDYMRDEYNTELPKAFPRPKEIRTDLGAQYATGLGVNNQTLKKNTYGTRSNNYDSTLEALQKTADFLRYEGRVLKFLAVEVSSPHKPYFPHLESFIDAGYGINSDGVVAPANAKRFALSYYLSNSSIELMVQKKTGERVKAKSMDDPKLILKKSKLPKNWRDVRKGRPAVMYEPLDFKCGQVIDVYGRYFLLVSCDSFTRNEYLSMGIEQTDVPLIVEKVEEVTHPYPAMGEGFLPIGSPEDTLSTVYGMPKPGKDVNKLARNQGRLIRCKAVMRSARPSNNNRTFVITFYLEDDTVQVIEQPERNAGIWGGTFLKRGRYQNEMPDDGGVPRWFVPTDVYLSAVFKINGTIFDITEMDNMSLRFCEENPDEFPMMDTFRIIGSIMEDIVNNKVNLREALQLQDKQRVGFLTQQQFVDVLDGLNLIHNLNDQELLTLLRRFKDGDRYMYNELVDLVSHVNYRYKHGLTPPTALKHQKNLDISAWLVAARGRTNQWRRSLRKDPHTLKGFVTLSVLLKFMHTNGMECREPIIDAFIERFQVPTSEAAPIMKQLRHMHASSDKHGGLQQKVLSRNIKNPADKDSLIKEKLRQHLLAASAVKRRNSSLS